MPSENAAGALALNRADALLLVIDVQERLASAMPPGALAALEKNAAVLIRAARRMEFSCGASKPIAREILRTGRKQAIVLGMEAHVCVFQTVRDLLRGGFSVFVAQDAVISRTEDNRNVGLRLCEKAGATVTSTETVLFDLLGVAGTQEFKEL